MLEYPGLKGPAVRFAEELSTVYSTEQLGVSPDTSVEQKVWTHQEIFSEVQRRT